MSNYNFNEIIKDLSMALIDDFRGFLVAGEERLEVPDDKLHYQIAFEEMSKVPGWKYISGTGQNPIVEFMKEKKAIYITKIPDPTDPNKFYRTVGYISDIFSNNANYRGVEKPEYLILRDIALGMGYDVDEYELLEKKDGQTGTPVSIKNYKGEMKVKTSHKLTMLHGRNLSEGDKPVFDSQNNIIGFISNGKFVNINNYERYANIPQKHDETNNGR